MTSRAVEEIVVERAALKVALEQATARRKKAQRDYRYALGRLDKVTDEIRTIEERLEALEQAQEILS